MEDRIREIQSKVDAERVQVSALENKVKDQRFKEYFLKRAGHALDDVEAMLVYATNSNNPVMWFAGAEFFLHIAQQQRKQAQDLVAKYGPDLVAIG
ncbi:MAG: hypothetical protein WAQ52_16775 [Terriglobales bacterium]